MKSGAFDIWYCKNCQLETEKNIKNTSIPKCKKCKSTKIYFRGQVAK